MYFQRADDGAEASDQSLLGERLPGRLGHADADDFRHRPAVVGGYEQLRRLEIAVDDALLVRVLHCLAAGQEQL
jgi:hypothetical protein